MTIVEAEVLSEEPLDADSIHLSGVFVDRIVINPQPEKRIEKITMASSEESVTAQSDADKVQYTAKEKETK